MPKLALQTYRRIDPFIEYFSLKNGYCRIREYIVREKNSLQFRLLICTSFIVQFFHPVGVGRDGVKGSGGGNRYS